MRKSTRKAQQAPVVSEAEQIARYRHLVAVLPESVGARAHGEAFAGLSADQQIELVDRLRPFLPDAGRDVTAEQLAVLVSDPGPRDEILRTGLAGAVASGFVRSAPVAAYFTVGLGSVTIDEQPSWVSELAHHESVPIDVAALSHRAGIDFKVWG